MNTEETTTITTKEWNGNFKDYADFAEIMENHKEERILAPIFILFAEYLGYVSQFNKLAEDWCDGKVPEVHVQKIMILEANCIFRQMKKDYPMEEIQYYYDSYYPLILKEYVDGLNKITEQ